MESVATYVDISECIVRINCSCGEMSGLADGGVVHAEIAADGAHHDLIGVDSDSEPHIHAVGALAVREPAR